MTWLALFWKGIRRRPHAAPNWEEGLLVTLGNQQSSEAALMNTALCERTLPVCHAYAVLTSAN